MVPHEFHRVEAQLGEETCSLHQTLMHGIAVVNFSFLVLPSTHEIRHVCSQSPTKPMVTVNRPLQPTTLHREVCCPHQTLTHDILVDIFPVLFLSSTHGTQPLVF